MSLVVGIADVRRWPERYVSCVLLQIHWLRNLLGPSDGLVVQILQWAGLRPVEPGAANLEAVLRMKFFVLVAVVLKRRALRSGAVTVRLWCVLPSGCSPVVCLAKLPCRGSWGAFFL